MYAIVTGGNAGMGLETAKELCRLGYFVTITARSPEKGQEGLNYIKSQVPEAKVQYMCMELKSLASVKQCAMEYLAQKDLSLHLLINNAGIMNTPYEMTSDGFEAQFQVNHLGHFLFTHYLLPRMRASGGGRVVNLSSRAHMRYNRAEVDLLEQVRTETPETYDGWQAYGRSKLCNILFARSLATKFATIDPTIQFFSLHPGLVDTKLLNVAPGLSTQAMTIEDGIKCCMFVATSPEVNTLNGDYFHESKVATETNTNVTSLAQSLSDAEKLWIASLAFVGLAAEEYGV